MHHEWNANSSISTHLAFVNDMPIAEGGVLVNRNGRLFHFPVSILVHCLNQQCVVAFKVRSVVLKEPTTACE